MKVHPRMSLEAIEKQAARIASKTGQSLQGTMNKALGKALSQKESPRSPKASM